MQLQITKDNFQQLLGRFTTAELEDLLIKHPYFQQAHLLLAKKYQQENSPKFDQQLQLAALYTQDRELLFTLFSDIKTSSAIVNQPPVVEPEVTSTQPVITKEETQEPFIIAEPVKTPEPVVEQVIETAQTLETEEPVTETVKIAETDETSGTDGTLETETPVKTEPEFSYYEPHTFDDWLKAFNKTGPTTEPEPIKEAKTEEEPPVNDDLERLYRENMSVDYLHELVEEETKYSKGLDKFIEEQIQRHKHTPVQKPADEKDLDPELITETMAKVYEMQKKYARAIKAYEILALKIPEKSGLFASRINYLKNIV